jgi:hypothetical protein
MIMYIADTDLVIEGFLNRPQVSPDAVDFWRQVEQASKKVSITEIGAKRITAYFESMLESTEDIESMIESVNSCFTVLEVTPDTIHEARGMGTKDFESAIEIVCARKYKAVAIITDREEAFQILGKNNDQTIEYIKPINFIDHKEPLYSKEEVESLFKALVLPTVCYASLNLFSSIPFQTIKSTMNLFYNIVLEYYKKIHYWINHININARRLKVLEEHIKIAHEYGGLDWGFYSGKYNKLNANWGNFQIILQYCSEHATYNMNYYKRLVSLWEALNRFSDLYSHREDRLMWLTKIIELSPRYQQWDNYFCALTRKAWTLVTLGRYEEAQEALNLAATKKDLIENRFLLTRYFHCCFSLSIRTNNLELAGEVLKLELSAISGLQVMFNSHIYKRELINFKGDSAKLLSRRVMNKIDICKIETKEEISDEDKQDLELSARNFNICAEMAKCTNWPRGFSYFLNKIADIKLVLCFISTDDQEKKQLLQEAQESLDASMDIAERNMHDRRMAYIYESYSRLAYLQNHQEQTNDYIIAAAEKHQKAGEFEDCKKWLKQKKDEFSLRY